MPLHRYHRPALPWGDYAHPRTGLPALLANEMARFAKRGTLDRSPSS